MESAHRHKTLRRLRTLVQHRKARLSVHGFSESATDVPSHLATGICHIDRLLEGGLQSHALHEVRCSYARDAGTAAGFLLGLLARIEPDNPLTTLWVTDPAVSADKATPWPDGLRQHGVDPSRFVFVAPKTLKNAMWAADEAAACSEVGALVFHLKGNPRRFDITATRRLMLRARQNRIFACILRQSGEEEASAAATRWHIETRCSSSAGKFITGIGHMRHVLALEKNRNGQTGQWLVAWNPHTRSFSHAVPESATAHPVSRFSNAPVGPGFPQETGQVMAVKEAS